MQNCTILPVKIKSFIYFHIIAPKYYALTISIIRISASHWIQSFWVFFFLSGFSSRTFTNNGTVGEGEHGVLLALILNIISPHLCSIYALSTCESGQIKNTNH